VPVVAAPSQPASLVVTVNDVPVTANGDGAFVVPQSSGGAGPTTIGSITTDGLGNTVVVIGGTTSSISPRPSGSVGDDVAAGIGEVEQSNVATISGGSVSISAIVLGAFVIAVSVL
jgi:hypothetical protein